MKKLLLAVATIALAASACGNLVDVEVIGKTAVSVDEAGQPIMVIMVCDQGIDTLVLARTREGLADDEPNAIEATWESSQPKSGLIEVSLSGANESWTGPAVTIEPSRGYILEGTSSSADVVTSQVSFTAAQLDALNSDQIIFGDGNLTTRADFEADSCPQK